MIFATSLTSRRARGRATWAFEAGSEQVTRDRREAVPVDYGGERGAPAGRATAGGRGGGRDAG